MPVVVASESRVASVEVGHSHAHASFENRFLLSAIAFQRTKQIKQGAKARVEAGEHKPTYLAVLEVLANTVSWSRD